MATANDTRFLLASVPSISEAVRPERLRPVCVGESPVPNPIEVLAVAPVSATQVEPLPTIKLESVVDKAAISASNKLYA